MVILYQQELLISQPLLNISAHTFSSLFKSAVKGVTMHQTSLRYIIIIEMLTADLSYCILVLSCLGWIL